MLSILSLLLKASLWHRESLVPISHRLLYIQSERILNSLQLDNIHDIKETSENQFLVKDFLFSMFIFMLMPFVWIFIL